jgi:hypothetical protein
VRLDHGREDAMRIRFLSVVAALALAIGAGPAGAVAPELLSYQGVLVRDNGAAVPNGVYSLRFRLFDHPTSGSQVFEQTLSTQVTNGLYNVILSNNLGYDLGDVMYQNSQLFMEVTVLAAPPAVPADITLLPRQQLASVPYAMSSDVLPTFPPPLVEADQKLHTNAANTATTATTWVYPAALQDLTLSVPSPGCVLEVDAKIVIAAPNNDRIVGALLEQKVNTGSYAAVRGPVSAWVGNQRPDTVSLSYVVENPAVGSYFYRVGTRAHDDNHSYIVSPAYGNLTSQSSLSGKLWCPES